MESRSIITEEGDKADRVKGIEVIPDLRRGGRKALRQNHVDTCSHIVEVVNSVNMNV